MPVQTMLKANRLTLFDRDIFEAFVRPGEVVEVRVLHVFGKSSAWGNEFAKGTVSGYFDDHNAFCKAVQAAGNTKHGGIYFTLQVIDPRLIGRTFNRLKPSKLTTADNNVLAYRWLPIDLDPVRPAGISSSDTELKAAWTLKDKIIEGIAKDKGWSDPIVAMSGNGVHLLYQLEDLPVNDASTLFIKNTLRDLAATYDTETVKIDRTVSNPGQVWKLYGTTARKGDIVPAAAYREARPHRTAYIINMGRQS